MSLIKCRECSGLMSNSAKACPTCGKPVSTHYSLTKIAAVAIVGFICYHFATGQNSHTPNYPTLQSTPKNSPCTVSDFSVEINNFTFANKCSQSDCYYMEGSATLTNACAVPSGAQLKIVGLNANNKPIASRNFWPESIRNIPVGKTVVSLDQALDHNSEITQITLEVIDTRVWKSK